jgi:glutathione peroxidase
MKMFIAALLVALVAGASQPLAAQSKKGKDQKMEGVLSFTMETIDGAKKALAEYKGEVLLIVNTASRCGYTKQYKTLEQLYEKYKGKGLRVLAFPANNFGAQEPGTNAEIRDFCETTFGVSFDMFAKISVKGDDMHPLYRYLTTQAGFDGDIKWNFNKFVVDRTGKVVARFDSNVDPMSATMTELVETLVAAR